MNIDNHSWWKGSFPSWMVAGLMTIIGFGGIRYVDEQSKINKQVMEQQSSIAKLQLQMDYQITALAEQKQANRDLVMKLDAVLSKIKL